MPAINADSRSKLLEDMRKQLKLPAWLPSITKDEQYILSPRHGIDVRRWVVKNILTGQEYWAHISVSMTGSRDPWVGACMEVPAA